MSRNSTPETREATRRGLLLGAAALSGGVAALAGAGRPARAQEPLKPGAAGSAASAGKAPIPVAVLIDQGATLVDFGGPWEILSSGVYQSPGFNVYSVAPSRAPISCDNGRQDQPEKFARALSGLKVIPDYTFDDAPTPRILVVGAQSGNDDPRKLEWIRHIYPKLDLAMSVCVGAFVLGNAGLLDGEAATTNANVYDDFEKKFPKTRLVRGVRFVESGKVATATGLTAGIDLALRVTDRFYGREAATKIARYEEWKSTAWMVDR